MNRDDLRSLAQERMDDAVVLLRNNRFSAAYYLCGYAVECALKACVARQTKECDFPPDPGTVREIYVHDLTKLLKSAGLDNMLNNDLQNDRHLQANWALAKDWSEKSRYQIRTKQQANDLFDAVSDEEHGVLQWISRHW